VAALGIILVGCAQAPSPKPVATATPTPLASGADGVVVTFRVAGQETYKVLLTEPADIELARAWQDGSAGPLIPNGRVVRGSDGGVNSGYSWHIDPDDVELAELSIEVCDGLPSHVEDGTLSGDRYCPWSAEIVSIEPAE
ncbi:MAG TPA: hypothetical protein VF153_06845, partial [Candidatus Limnocylindria bacterium]